MTEQWFQLPTQGKSKEDILTAMRALRHKGIGRCQKAFSNSKSPRRRWPPSAS
jgi:hypothetical protein